MKYQRNEYEEFVLSLRPKDFRTPKFDKWNELTMCMLVLYSILAVLIAFCLGMFHYG